MDMVDMGSPLIQMHTHTDPYTHSPMEKCHQFLTQEKKY